MLETDTGGSPPATPQDRVGACAQLRGRPSATSAGGTLLHTPLVPGAAAAARLLAVRMAGAAMDGPFRLRSRRFEELLEERAVLAGERERLRTALLAALHAAVPTAEDSAARRALLHAKRDVFNGRDPGRPPAGTAPVLATRLECFGALVRAEAALWNRNRVAVLEELGRGVDGLLSDRTFAAAIRYASPGLWEELERGTPSVEEGLPCAWRGVYAYAARFFGKANPFHLFAAVGFPRGEGDGRDAECEVVLDASLVEGLEQELLPQASPARVRLCLRPWTSEGGALRFWVPASGGYRIVPLRATAAVEAVASFFTECHREDGRPVSTRAACEAWLRERLPPCERDAAGALVDLLVERGAAAAYLVTDPDRFAAELAGISPAHEERVAVLGRHHLARTDAAGAVRVQAELEAAGVVVREGEPSPFYVNRYLPVGAAPEHEAAARTVGEDLRCLKPFFGAESSFGAHQQVLRAFVRDTLGDTDGTSAPLLELLRRFLRSRSEIVARYRTGREQRRRAAWHASLAGREGVVSERGLAALPRFPGSPAVSADEELCFNGPLDHATGLFHVSNVFAGGGRFASRYLLHRGTDPHGAPPPEEGVVEVELAVPPPPNLHYVLRALPAGCGFDARRSHLYSRWICPSDLVVEARGRGLVYRHAATGERLRFHYRGFALGVFLPAEYQMLLLGSHADAFINPFDGSDPAPPPGEVRHRPGLRFGRVQLRRERWVFRGSELAGVVEDDDPLRLAARLRDWVHSRLAPGADEWYYRASGPAGSGRRPRFLDLRNPLAAQLFRRALARERDGGVVAMSVMDPPLQALWRQEGGSHTTELMIEV